LGSTGITIKEIVKIKGMLNEAKHVTIIEN